MLIATLKEAMHTRGWSGLSGWMKILYLYIFRAWFWSVCAEHFPSNLTPFSRRLQGVKIWKGVVVVRRCSLLLGR